MLSLQNLVFTQQSSGSESLSIRQLVEDDEPVAGTAGDAAYQTIQVLKGIVDGFKGMLNSFVSNTPDVTGISTSQVTFASGSFDTAKVYSDRLLALVISIYIIFLSLEAMNLIIKAGTKEQSNINQILRKNVLTLFLLITTPYILSYSIQGVNLFCQYILNGIDLTSFLVAFLNKIQEGFTPAGSDPLSWASTTLGSLTNPIGSFLDGFKAFITLLPIFLIAILYILIIGQFVIRFIKLYFLAAIYPIVIIFFASPIQTNYIGNYWNCQAPEKLDTFV